jgi:hypothetical protein
MPSNSRTKTTKLLLLAVCSGLLLGAAAVAPTPLPPPVSLKEAVRVAENFVADKKIDLSEHYLGSVSIQSDTHGQLHWDAQWIDTNSFKGDWFIIRVQMDRTAALIRGK